jgi:hypothetical protein
METVVDTSVDVGNETVDASRQANRRQVWAESGALALTALLFAIVLMVVLRRAVMRWLYGVLGDQTAPEIAEAPAQGQAISNLNTGEAPAAADTARSRATRLLVGVGITLTRLATPLVALFAARFSLIQLQIFGETGEIVLNGIAWGVAIWATAYAIVYAFFAPSEPRLRLSLLDTEDARFAAYYAMTIATAMSLNHALVETGQLLGWPEAALSVINAAIITGGALALWRFARVTGKSDVVAAPAEGDAPATEDAEQWLSRGAGRVVRRISYAVAIVSPLLAFAGFFALSRFIFGRQGGDVGPVGCDPRQPNGQDRGK